MDSVEFTKGSRPALLVEVANATKYVSQGLKGFQGVTTPHCIASMKKFTVYNKTAANLKIVQRLTGKGGDLEVASPVLDMVALDYDSDYCVAALENGTVVVLRCTENPDNSVAAVVEDTFPVTDVVRVVVTQRGGTTHNASDATAGKLIVAVNSKGAVTLIHGKAVEPAGDVGGAVSAVGAGDGIVAFARGNRVIVRSADRLTESGLLSKPWLPHGDDTVDFVHVFRKSPTIVTSSGSEVRLWTVGKDVATLHQTVLINGLGPQTLKSTDPNDEYVFIVEKASGSTLVLEVNTKAAPVVERVTEWSLGEETVSISGALRKVANDAAARTDVALCARTSTGVSRFVFDGARLHGPVNVDPSANGGTTGNGGSDSVKKWFANTTPVSQPPAAMTPAGFTHITSTTGGLTTTKSSVDARAAQEALLDLQQNFAGILAQFDSQIVALERQASESLGVLRAGGAAASAAGEASARQVAGGLLSGASSNQQADSNAFVVNQDVLNGFTSAITEAATITVQHALAAGLKHHAANAADRALTIIANANSNDRETLQLPKVTQLPSMQALAEAIDKAQAQQNDLFRRQKEQDAAKYLSMVKLQQAKAAKGVADVKKYLNDLDSEIQGLKVDISSIQTWSSPAAAAEPIPETDDQIYGEAMRLAEAGQWGNALFKAANAGKLSVLSRFLDSDLIRANEGEVASTANLSVPLYVSIAQQLTSDIKDSVGFIPMRVQWLHAFTLAFDELLTDGKQSKTIDNVRADISNVVDALSAAEDHKGSLDRTTKRHITVVKKALQPHGL